jgi:gas vesicle protein
MNMKTTKAIVLITAAAAAGVAVGMLLAPEKGSDLQKRLRKNADDLLKEFTGLINNGKQFADDAAREAERMLESSSRNSEG